VGGDGHALDRLPASFETADGFAGIQVPQADDAVPTTRNGPAAIRSDRHAHDRGGVSRHPKSLLTCFKIPKADSRVIASRDAALTIRQKCPASDPALTLLEDDNTTVGAR